MWLSYLVKKKIKEPTSNFKVLGIFAHLSTLVFSVLFVVAINYTFGFGIGVNLLELTFR